MQMYEVVESTYCAANNITHTLHEYGNGNMGAGLRRFGENMKSLGFSLGRNQGIVEGIAYTFLGIGSVGAIVWGVTKWRKRKEDSSLVKSETIVLPRVLLDKILLELSEEERTVIMKIYGLNNISRQTREQIAEELNLPIDYIHLLETNALRKLRRYNLDS